MDITAIYERPNILKLPYVAFYKTDETGSLLINQATGNKIPCKCEYYTFKPGMNKIDKEIWDKIVECPSYNADYYSQFIKIKMPTEDIEVDEFDISTYTVNDAKEIITECFDIAELKNFLVDAESRGGGKKGTIKAIKERIDYLEDLYKKGDDDK